MNDLSRPSCLGIGIPQQLYLSLGLLMLLLPGCRDSAEYTPIDPQVFQEQYDLSDASEPAQIGIQLLQRYRQEPEGRQGESLHIRYLPDQNAEMLITLEGLADDSVQGKRYRLEMAWTEAGWQVETVGSQQRCWPGRGQQNWSPQPCV
ncbi:hypothetical protein L1047_11970 [Synechococcus sp. Nb3U1]|uniref:hypothetical protein n=1 Tax=Synechococcus sp. Nb3U1 TaxID=1914529 RepID=UPI001F30C4F1|nr:hypothetical protein [Synechococcus sp. Nb3U1]MCF2971912.1 hypothetical protein [Synechococcus sp. Nb3U1]